VELPPWQAFRLSLDVLAEEDARPSAFEVRADLESQRLIYQELPLRDGAWKRFHLVFNSLEGGSARIRIGVYRRSPGKVSVDNVRLEPAGLLNVLRREDLPVIVRRPDGSTLSEGRDLEEVHDPMLAEITRGRPLSLGHAPPSIRLRSRNAARTGDLLYVSYFHPVVFERYRVTLSLCAPGVDRLLRDQARWMKVLFGAKRSMVDLSEIRLVGYEPSCGSLPGGELVRTALLRAAKALEEEGSRAVVWSDMLDPLAHAKSPYYLVRGGAAGSWQDLPAGMTVVNWNSVARGESLRFFSELGHPQIVSVNETDPRAVQEEAIRLGRETPGVEGFMYTTWRSDYARLCSFAGMTRDSE
jgi:hypothetical protein